jgi:aldehyde:ferredoxin oxidoreductase
VGRILRIDLTHDRIDEQNLSEVFTPNDLRNYVGCFGLGLKLLYRELPLGVRPLDPENPIIIMPGPLTGLALVPGANNTTKRTQQIGPRRCRGGHLELMP